MHLLCDSATLSFKQETPSDRTCRRSADLCLSFGSLFHSFPEEYMESASVRSVGLDLSMVPCISSSLTEDHPKRSKERRWLLLPFRSKHEQPIWQWFKTGETRLTHPNERLGPDWGGLSKQCLFCSRVIRVRTTSVQTPSAPAPQRPANSRELLHEIVNDPRPKGIENTSGAVTTAMKKPRAPNALSPHMKRMFT